MSTWRFPLADLSSFIPIRSETLDTIIARLDADLNAGVPPGDDRYIDTTPGTFYADIRTAFALEMERLWDVATTDTVAASLAEFAWGDYLDAHGLTIGLLRSPAAAATGEVTFTGTNGSIIGTGAEVSTIQTEADSEAIAFLTTEGGEVTGGSITLAVAAELPGSAGNVATGAVELLMSGIVGIASVTNAAAITGGEDVEDDEQYRDRIKLGWSAAQGSGSMADYQRWALAYPGVGNVRVTPIWNGAGTVRVVVTDVENNPVSGAVLAGLQALIDPYEAETAADGPQSPTTILTVDSTVGFRSAGRIYIGDVLATYTGTTATTFTGCTGLPGSVLDNAQVVQHGNGTGLAPVGAIVSIRTATTVTVPVAMTIRLRDGYTLDGDSGTIATRAEIESVLASYINSLPPGGDPTPGVDTGVGSVLRFRVMGDVMRLPGVFNISVATLNAVAVDFAVNALQVPEMGTVTITTT